MKRLVFASSAVMASAALMMPPPKDFSNCPGSSRKTIFTSSEFHSMFRIRHNP